MSIGEALTLTGDDGRFEFNGIAPGSYDLTATYSVVDTGFVSRTLPITVTSGLDAGTLTLPNPVLAAVTGVTNRTVSLTWTESTDAGFREYKVYRRAFSTALDEVSGELVHIETSRGSTQLVHGASFLGITGPLPPTAPVRPVTQYFYRVYVMDEFGLLGGSNIVEANTLYWAADSFDIEYDLVVTRQLGVEAPVAGLAYDGAKLWVLYASSGPYWDNKLVRLVGLDPTTGETLVEHAYDDDHRVPIGLTWDGTLLWIHYPNEGTSVRGIDPLTGTEARRWSAQDTEALGWDGMSLLLAQRNGGILAIDPETGANNGSIDAPFPEGWLTGVTAVGSHIWVSNAFRAELALLTPDGEHAGIARLPSGWTNGGVHLTVVDGAIVVATTAIVMMQAVPR